MRYFFSSPSSYSETISRYLFVWLVMYGSAYVFGQREHMSITFILDKMSPKIKTIVEMLGELIIALFAWSVLVFGGYIQSKTQMFQMDGSLPIPMGFIYSAAPISGIFIIFYFVCNEIQLIKKFMAARLAIK
jgi:TRAP-type C4-dicarboxylate transport system permease small subunit